MSKQIWDKCSKENSKSYLKSSKQKLRKKLFQTKRTEKYQLQIEAKTFAEEIRLSCQWQIYSCLYEVLVHQSHHVIFVSEIEEVWG